MPVFALWSAPRARSTAFFRSMLERGDLLALHEPLEGLTYFGDTEVQGRTFESPTSLLAWLLGQTHDNSVFLKETTDHRVLEVVLADRRFLAEARHAFLIRRPEEIAASLYALEPGMGIEGVGLEMLHELHAAVRDAGGHGPVVIDSDDLVARPEATMAAYCATVQLPFIAQALTWEPGERPEWRRSGRWHVASVPAPASSTASVATRTPSRRPTSWRGSPPTTCPSTRSSTRNGSTSRHRSQWSLLTDQPATPATSAAAARQAASVPSTPRAA